MGGAIYEMRAAQTMVCAIVEAQGEGSGEGEEITVPIFSSSPLNCRRLRFSGGGKTVVGGGEVVCVRGCDTNASNYCHMRSLSLSRSESFPRHSGKQTHSSLVCLPRLPPFHHSSPLFSITIISTRVKQSLLEHGQKYYSYCDVTTMYLGLVAKF